MKRRTKRSKKDFDHLEIRIIQNGFPVADFSCLTKGHRELAVSNDPRDPLCVPHYPFPDQKLQLIKIVKGQVFLTIPFKWQGFCTSRGEPIPISRPETGGRTEWNMVKGDYASLILHDLRIVVKVTPKPIINHHTLRYAKEYRKSLASFLLSNKDDARSLLIGTAAALIIVGSFCIGLIKRPFSKPETIGDLTEDYILSFMHPDHLTHAPEALQSQYNKKTIVYSTLSYYQNAAAYMIAEKTNPKNYPEIFDLDASKYKKIFAESSYQISSIISQEVESNRAIFDNPDQSKIVIPSAFIESAQGRTSRVLDKIETLQESFADALKRRRELTISFMKDEEYSYEDYKQKAKPTKASETLAKIKPWEQLSDEQLMYQHAESYAEKARKRQRYSRRPKKSLGPEVPMDPITISSPGHDVALEPGLWSSLRDKKLADLDGVIYSTAKEKIVPKEPLSGFIEPHLVESFIRQNRYQLQLCYELALRRDEAVSGKTEWRWRIDSRGTISDLELIHSSIKDRQLMKCLEDKISRWRFPRPRRGAVEVSYPFEFAPNKG